MKNMVLGAALLLASCNASAQAERNTAEYQDQIARLSTGMSVGEVDDILGAPYFEDTAGDAAQYSCRLYHDTASDGRAIMHEVRFTDGQMRDHIVGLDMGVMACSAMTVGLIEEAQG